MHHTREVQSALPKRPIHQGPRPHTYESRGGSQIVLEFADPMVSPSVEREDMFSPMLYHHASNSPPLLSSVASQDTPILNRATSWSGVLKRKESSTGTSARTPSISNGNVGGAGHSRLQVTFQAIKNMSAGLASPRFDFSPNKKIGNEDRSPGYFDVNTEEGRD